MKKILTFSCICFLYACNTQPVVYTTPQPQTYVQSNQDYQVIIDPLNGNRNVVYMMNGLQYVIAYNTFMGWYNYGGYGYVNSMYGSNRTYFNSYNSSRYRSWKSSSFRDTYRGPSRTTTNNTRVSSTPQSSFNRPITSSSSSFNRPSQRASNPSSSFSRPSSTLGGRSSYNRPSSSNSSSFNRPSSRSRH